MGVVDSKGAYPLVDPKQYSVAQLFPQSSPIRIVEIDIDDVLVFLRWVLSVFNCTIRPETEPLRMLAHPGVIGSALDREIERHLEAERSRRADEAAEI